MNMVTVNQDAFTKARKQFKTSETMARAIGKEKSYVYKIKKYGKCSEDAAIKIEEITGVNIIGEVRPRTRARKTEEVYEQTTLFPFTESKVEKSLRIWAESLIDITNALLEDLGR